MEQILAQFGCQQKKSNPTLHTKAEEFEQSHQRLRNEISEAARFCAQ